MTYVADRAQYNEEIIYNILLDSTSNFRENHENIDSPNFRFAYKYYTFC